MNNPEESAVRDLGRFALAVLNGMVDLQNSAAELIRYEFSFRTVKDVIRRGSEDPELINQIFDHINHLVIYLNEEIVETSRKATPVGMEDRHFTELQKRMQLMYEVWLGMKMNEAYQVPALMNHVEASREAVKYAYGTCEDYHRWKKLPSELREFFLDEQKEVKSAVEEVEPIMFAREDGVVSSIAHEKANSDDEGKKKQFVAKTEKVLSNYRAKNPDYKTMRELINVKTKYRLEGIYCDNLINEFISVWDMATDPEAVNPKEKYAFTALLKKVFLMMVDKRRNDFAAKLFDKYNKDAGVLPCLENFVEHFQSGLTEAMNQLPLDSNVLSNNMELFEKTKDPIIWFLLVSPAYTVQQLLTICVDNKGYIAIINRIFRVLPTLFERSIHVTPLPFEEEGKKEKLLLTILHRVFMIGRTTWKSASQWENAGMMTMSFAKNRNRKEGQPEKAENKALLDPFSLVNFALTELLKEHRKPLKSVEIFVKMLQRLLANNNNARMSSNYMFATSFNEEGENTISTPILVHLLFELLAEYDELSVEVCDGARDVLKSVSSRMSSGQVVFDSDTCHYLTDDNFNNAPWWIKYALYTWFSTALRNPKKQVPSGVYKTIPEQFLDEFDQIKLDETASLPDCFMRSLFELGLFDVELAIELLKFGYGIKFETSVVERMALALVDSYGKKMSKRQGGLEIGKLITAMLETFDPIRELAPLTAYCTCYLESLKKIEYILVLFMAARISKEKQLSAAKVRTGEIKQITQDELFCLNEIAEQLMDIFCETTKTHIEREASEVEKLRREADALIFSPGCTPDQFKALIEKEEREQSLTLQLTMIYLKCSHFCRLYQNVPIKLQQLMNSTLEKQYTSQKLLAKKVMDDVLTEQRKTEVVYAFVEQKGVPIEPKELDKETVQPVKPSDLYTPKQPTQPSNVESTSAENPMFSHSNGDKRQGRDNYAGNRGNNRRFDNDRPSSSRGNVRSERCNSYRGSRWHPVNDVQTFSSRDRDFVHKKTKNATNSDFERTFSRDLKNSYDQDKLYYEDRRSPFNSPAGKMPDDVRRYSESKDSNYDPWEDQSRRFTSESDYSHDDTENRYLDQTIRSVRNFSQRDQQQRYSRPGTSSITPPKASERKQPKKGFASGEPNRYQSNTRKPADRKHRYTSHSYEQEEEMIDQLKPGQPEREDLADALGLNNREQIPSNSRRGGFHR
ncbi:hypothetical protein CRE_01887 [Caenorhabditis remanei]|uniref:Edg1 TPR repeats region domain-containing protein n=1 Tax=Caenorhabditis remanei TaxID=31234 RepID=E3LG29_CAERE|nr:hypothetical protein CRE_01887 [Caenorhabditis remanei]